MNNGIVKIELTYGESGALELRKYSTETSEASEPFWDTMSDGWKEGTAQVMKDALRYLDQNVDVYLPNVVTDDGSTMISISVKVLMADMEEFVAAMNEKVILAECAKDLAGD